MDWALTLPVLVLIPMLLIPLLHVGASSPSLSMQGSATAGGSLNLAGREFPGQMVVAFAWDGEPKAWLAPVTTHRSGSFQEKLHLPKELRTGTHTVTAFDANLTAQVLASLEVTVVAPPTVSGTPVPSTAGATPVPSTAGATPVPSTAGATPVPSTAGATPVPSSAGAVPVPPASGPVVGYGWRTVGGAGGVVIGVDNVPELRAAVARSGPRIIVFTTGGAYDLGGENLKIESSFLTIDGTNPNPVVLKRGGIQARNTHDIIIRNLRSRPGDQVTKPDDVDALTLLGLAGSEVYNVVVDHCTLIWGPDIGGAALLGRVHDVTISNSIIGLGLYLSAHAEGTVAHGGHAKGLNIAQQDQTGHPSRITLYGNLLSTATERMPQVKGADFVDVVNNVIYNFGAKAVSGAPYGLNIVGNYLRRGPVTQTNNLFTAQTSSDVPSLTANSVYQADNYGEGFALAQGAPASVYRTSLASPLSVGAVSPQVAFNIVVASVGPNLRDPVDQSVVNDLLSYSGRYYNGLGYPGPNPY